MVSLLSIVAILHLPNTSRVQRTKESSVPTPLPDHNNCQHTNIVCVHDGKAHTNTPQISKNMQCPG